MTLPNEIEEAKLKEKAEEEEEKLPILEETYPLIPPFAYAMIKTDPRTRRTMYHVIETPLKKREKEVVDTLKEKLIENIDIVFGELTEEDEKYDYLREKIENLWKKEKIALDVNNSFDKVFYYVSRDFIGFGRLEPLLRDQTIEDISCDGVGIPIYIWHRKYESIPTNLIFRNAEELNGTIIKIAQRSGRHISIANPILDASLPDGSRVQLTYGKEVTQRGSTFTIRKFRADPLTITDLLQFNTINTEMAAYLWYLIENRHSALIAGGIASGKTTLLNTLSMFIMPGLKIVTIEDTAELNIPHENVISSISRTGLGVEEEGRKRGSVTLFDLLKASLRQRPDYIIVGEIRGEEAYFLFQAMATGHLGMATIHGDSVSSVIHRLESKPMNIPRSMLTSLDAVVVQRKVRYGGAHIRRSIEISEMVGMDAVTSELLTNRVYTWNAKNDSFDFLGRSVKLEQIRDHSGLTDDDIWHEIDKRKAILGYLVKKGIRYYQDVANTIREFYHNPDRMYKKAKRGLGL
ncbi:MAG: type II/IV secretion system ATPase subunit [Promethearchaeota archaeon]